MFSTRTLARGIRESAKMTLLRALTLAAFASQAVALAIGGRQLVVERESDGLQDIVSAPRNISMYVP
jgi:hypothetical protein